MKPVYYAQTDSRWSGISYSAPGESTTIGKAGCGPTCAAMVIASLKDATVTPATTAKWSIAHGYKALHSGTYYSYFVPQFYAYGIKTRQMNRINNYHHSDQATLRASVTKYLKAGKWIIACMGKGTWTSSGHFILAYGISDGGKVLINDPASTKEARTRGNLDTFLKEAKYFWLIDEATDNDSDRGEDKGLTSQEKQEIKEMIDVAVKNAVNELFSTTSDDVPEWFEDEFAKAKELGLTDGSRPLAVPTRVEMAVEAYRTYKAARKEGGVE